LTLAIFLFSIFWSFGIVASESSGQADVTKIEAAAAVKNTTPAPETAKGGVFFLPWGIAGGVVVIVILYFVFTKMERKATSEFETTIIDDIVSAMKDEYSLAENDLRDLVTGILASRRCSDSRLTGLLRIEYEVEKTSSSRVKRTTAVAVKKQNDIIVMKATRTMAWEDLPGPIRKEFILKNENVLVYSLYSDSEKEG
jgi:hypothetical protein